jgi:transposase
LFMRSFRRQTKPPPQNRVKPMLPVLSRPERKRIEKIIHKTQDKEHSRRLTAILMLHQGHSVSTVHQLTAAARSSIQRWLGWYQECGLSGLESKQRGRFCSLPYPQIQLLLEMLLEFSPEDFGYHRSRWSSELFATLIHRMCPEMKIASSTIRRWLPKMGVVWRRAAPTLHIRDPHRDEKMAQINKALQAYSVDTPVFYVDEADIDLNPKIGADWMKRHQQKRIPTPGKNEKHYVAGALNSKSGKVIYTTGLSKDSELFIQLLEKLKRHYRRARKIVLVLDNYVIHKSHKTQKWLEANPKIELLFQPVYSPWVNRIELLWRSMHEMVTRNHRCRAMWELLRKVKYFLDHVSPYATTAKNI